MGKFLRTFFRFCRIIPKSRTANRTRTPSYLFQGLKSIHGSAGFSATSRRFPLPKRNMKSFFTYSRNSNHVLTHSQIYERIWREPDYGEARKLVSHHVQAIRRKLNLKPDSGVYLRCIRDVGVQLREKEMRGSSLNQAAASFYSFGPEEAESVGALPVLPHLEVEMVSGRVPGGAYIANHLALLDLLACHHTDGGTVGIQGFIGVVVAHFDVVPVSAAPGVYPVGDGDGAIRRPQGWGCRPERRCRCRCGSRSPR